MLIQLFLVRTTISLAACDRDLCSVAPATETKAVRLVTPNELHVLVQNDRKPTIIDANPKEIFDEGHVPGSRWMATENVRDYLPADHAALVVFYCYSEACGASHAAAMTAIAEGWSPG
jgi:hypothetical protein